MKGKSLNTMTHTITKRGEFYNMKCRLVKEHIRTADVFIPNYGVKRFNLDVLVPLGVDIPKNEIDALELLKTSLENILSDVEQFNTEYANGTAHGLKTALRLLETTKKL